MNVKLSNDLISQFVNITNDTSEPIKETTVYGTVVVDDDITYVQIDGSDRLTPVTTVTNVIDGERVTVMIKNHSAVITGNITSPSARGKDVELSVNSLNVKIDGVGNMASGAVAAANSAQSTANAANEAAGNAATVATEAARYATDYLTLSKDGLEIGSSTHDTNVLISPDAIDFRKGDTVLASYESEYIYLGKASRKATIDIANGVARLYNEDNTQNDYSRLVIEADHSITMSAMCGIYKHVYYDDGNLAGGAHFRMESHLPWYEDSTFIRGRVELSTNTKHYSGAMNSTACLQMDEYNLRLYFRNHSVGSTIEFSTDNINIDTPTAKFEGNVYLNQDKCIYGVASDGVPIQAFSPLSSSGNVSIGHGNYENNYGNTHIYGSDVRIYSAKAGNVGHTPYFRAGHNVTVAWLGAGYVTSSASKVCFSIPLAKPVIGSPTVSVSSVDGLMIRQMGIDHTVTSNVYYNKGVYTHGSSNTTYTKPSSYSATLSADGSLINISANMSDTTNAANNTACGISASIKITFS